MLLSCFELKFLRKHKQEQEVGVALVPVDIRWFVIKCIFECCGSINHISSSCMKNTLEGNNNYNKRKDLKNK